MVGDGDVTVAPPPESAQCHPSGGEGHVGRNGPGAGERPFSSGGGITGRCNSSVRRRPGGKGADGASRCCFCSHGELPYGPKQGDDGAETLAPAPNTAQRHLSNIWSDCVYVHWCSRGWGEHKRQTRSTARIRRRIASGENSERSRHKPGANVSTWKRLGSPGPCRRKGWQ